MLVGSNESDLYGLSRKQIATAQASLNRCRMANEQRSRI